MAAYTTLSDRGRKNASARVKATIQQDKKYDPKQNPTGIISLDNADNVIIHMLNLKGELDDKYNEHYWQGFI